MRVLRRNHRQVLPRIVAAMAIGAIAFLAFRAHGWPGLGLAFGGVVMWALLNMSRMLLVLRRTARNPVGFVGSAVMLHARLERGMALLQVLALTRALGQLLTATDNEPAEYQWTDGSQVSVRCSFMRGKLIHWHLLRP